MTEEQLRQLQENLRKGKEGKGINYCPGGIKPVLSHPEAIVKASKKQSQMEKLKNRFESLWKELGGEAFKAEVTFHPTRKWRFDYTVGDWAIDLQGGIWIKSGHSSGAGINRDAEKFSHAALLGWKVIIITEDMITNGKARDILKDVISRRNWSSYYA